MLEIKDLHVEVDNKPILKGINLHVRPGEIHVIMGPNGVGKSTLSKVIGGDPAYTVTEGSITFEGTSLAALTPDQRAHLGLFWTFQDPLEIQGLPMAQFLRAALDAKHRAQGIEPLAEEAFSLALDEIRKKLKIEPERLERSVNVGCSGGEKKKNEVLQLALLQPKLAVLDEIDSGLDVDALKVIFAALQQMKRQNQSYICITHYSRVLTLIEPDFVHILLDGKIARTGRVDLAVKIEERGYDALECAR